MPVLSGAALQEWKPCFRLSTRLLCCDDAQGIDDDGRDAAAAAELIHGWGDVKPQRIG